MTFTVVLKISMSNVEEEKTENWFAYSSMMAHSEPDRNSREFLVKVSNKNHDMITKTEYTEY